MKVDVDRIDNTNAASLLQLGESAIQGGDYNLDLSAVQRCDSSAVALLIAWQRAARGRGQRVRLEGIPPSLCSLATLYGVAPLISCPPLQSKPSMSSSAMGA